MKVVTKMKGSRKKNIFEFCIFFLPLFYTLLLPALFAYYPEPVTAWLDAWHILFGNLPAIAAFVSEAEHMVNKHGQSMPYTYYIHGFWVYFCAVSLSVYGLFRVLKADKGWFSGVNKIGYAAYHVLFFVTLCIIFLFFSVVFNGWFLDALFEYTETGRMGILFGNWLGFQYQPLFIVFSGFIFVFFAFLGVFNLISYYFNSPRLLRWLKHKGK